LGTVRLIVGFHDPWGGVALGIIQVLVGVAVLLSLEGYRRAIDVNEPFAMPPGRG
jgi:hypothetical protein